MNSKNIRQAVQDLVAQNKTEEAIELLAQSHFDNIDREIILLNSKFNKVKEEQRMGIISREDANLELAQINLAIVEITDALEDNEELPEAGIPARSNKRPLTNPYMISTIVLALAVVGYLAIRVGSGRSGKARNVSEPGKTVEKTQKDPLEGTYIICESAFPSKQEAQRRVAQLTVMGFNGKAGFIWVPDYDCLSGAKLYQVYIGPFANKRVATQALCKFNRGLQNKTYGVRLCREGQREVFNCE